MRPSSPLVELVVVVVVRSGSPVSGGDSEDVVGVELVSVEDSEEVIVSLVLEASVDVSALLDVLDGAVVEAADEEDLPSVVVSVKAGCLGACASTVAKGNMANKNKIFMDATFRRGDRRISRKSRGDI